jgi:putative redox protein
MSQISVHLSEKLRASITTRDHQFFADEPIEAGGENSGATPYDYLLAALGACTVMTLRLYADRKGWDLKAVNAVLSHERQHIKDCLDCTGEEAGPYIDRLQATLDFKGDLDEEQRGRLLEIAGRCPVHRTLLKGPKITIRPGS